MKRIILNIANFCKEFFQKITGNVQYYYLRYFSKKAKETVERISVGKPTKGSRGTMLYYDLHQNATRSYTPLNLCEIRKINTQNELTHYQKYLSTSAQNLSVKNLSLVATPQTVCKPVKESEDFAGSQIDENPYKSEIKESGFTQYEEDQQEWELIEYEMQMYYDSRHEIHQY